MEEVKKETATLGRGLFVFGWRDTKRQFQVLEAVVKDNLCTRRVREEVDRASEWKNAHGGQQSNCMGTLPGTVSSYTATLHSRLWVRAEVPGLFTGQKSKTSMHNPGA